METSLVFDLIPHYKRNYSPDNDVVAGKVGGMWIKYNIREFSENVDYLSSAFINIGIKKDDKIASIISNGPKSLFLDMSIMQVGAIHVPINPTSSISDIDFIIHHAEPKIIFVQNASIYNKIKPLIQDISYLKGIYAIEAIDDIVSWTDIINIGLNNLDKSKLEAAKNDVHPGDPALLIYTSGTTGMNKGVLLSHQGLMSNCKAMSEIPDFGEGTRALSFLPLSHIFERLLNYMYLYKGISIFYAESIPKFQSNCQEIRPKIMCCVPRFLEEIYRGILAKGKTLKGIQKRLFFWAIELAKKYEANDANGWLYKLKLEMAYKMVLHRIGEALGGNLKIIACGGSAIDDSLLRLFLASKVPVYEGYGLTETSPVIATSSPRANCLKIGTVGPPLNNVNVKLADNNEILVNGPSLMLGYFRDPELTAQVIDVDGWFHTGDTGGIDEDGHLFLTGRIKENFKTTSGKWIVPQPIEQALMASDYISFAVVVGENQIVAGAIIAPNFNATRKWCIENNIHYTTDNEMVKSPQVVGLIKREVEKVNLSLQMIERIRPIYIVPDQWSADSGELTSTLKVKRNVVIAKYSAEIAGMYKT